MIKFFAKENGVDVQVDPGMFDGKVITVRFITNNDWYADLLRQKIFDQMQSKIKSIREKSYLDGWKDAKAKVRKKTWWSGWW